MRVCKQLSYVSSIVFEPHGLLGFISYYITCSSCFVFHLIFHCTYEVLLRTFVCPSTHVGMVHVSNHSNNVRTTFVHPHVRMYVRTCISMYF